MKRFKLSGPRRAYSFPWGRAMMPRKDWFVSRDNRARCIVRFENHPRRYIIDNTYPIRSFRSLCKAVAWAKRSLRPGRRERR